MPSKLKQKRLLALQFLKNECEGVVQEKEDTVFIKENEDVLNMAYIYDETLRRYLNLPFTSRFPNLVSKGFQRNTKTLLEKAVAAAKELKADFKDYISAQFYWFDKWFKRYPKLFEICPTGGKFDAKVRFMAWKELSLNTGHLNTFSVVEEISVPYTELDTINRKRLNELTKSWNMPELEVLDKFACVFDTRWLKKQKKH